MAHLPGKRVLYLVPNLLGSHGGIARHARTVCYALRELDCSLSLIALNDRPETLAEAAALLPGVRYEACSGSRSMFVRRAIEALWQRPDLVLIEHANFSTLGWLLARVARAPLVVFVHGIEIWRPLSRVRQLAFRRADQIIAVSFFTMKRAVTVNGADGARLRVLHNCLDPSFQVARTLPEPVSGPSLLTVSRLSATEGYKGHDQVIRSLPALLEEFPSLVYNIVGDGDLRPQLEQLSVELGVAKAVRFHGMVTEKVLEEHYARATIFVMPSRAEGFGYVFVEAMAHGKPVVAGNRDASVEVVRDDETGFLIDPRDLETLTNRIRLLLRDGSLRDRMGANGLDVVRGEFSFSAFRDALAAHLLDAFGRRGKSASEL